MKLNHNILRLNRNIPILLQLSNKDFLFINLLSEPHYPNLHITVQNYHIEHWKMYKSTCYCNVFTMFKNVYNAQWISILQFLKSILTLSIFF